MVAAGRNESLHDVWLDAGGQKKGFRLAADEAGNLVYRPGLAPFSSSQIYSGRFSMESVNANIDVPISWQSWRGGAAFVEVDLTQPRTAEVYDYSQGVNASWPDHVYLSPLSTLSGTFGSPPIKFVESELGQFVLTKRYLFRWDGAAWAQVYDAGADNRLNDLFEYRNSNASYVVLAVDEGPYYHSVDGTTWLASEGTSTVPTFVADAFSDGLGTRTIPVFPSVQEDDLLIAVVVGPSTQQTPNDGQPWTMLSTGVVYATVNYTAWWRRADTSEPASYAFFNSTGGTAQSGFLYVGAWRGARATTYPFEGVVVNANNAAATTSFTSGPVGPAVDENRLALLVAIAVPTVAAPITWTGPLGFTEVHDEGYDINTVVDYSIGVYEREQDTGTLTAQTITGNATGRGVVLSLLIGPKAVGPHGVHRFAVRSSALGEPVLWSIDANGRVRNTTDPTNVESWSAADDLQMGSAAGDPGGPYYNEIAGLEVMDNEFFLVANEGLTSYDGAEISTVWDAGTLHIGSLTDDLDPCRPLVWADRRLYFTYSGSLMRYEQETNSIQHLWPRGSQKGHPELNGIITALAGDAYNFYFAIRNLTGETYILKGDPREPIEVAGELIFPFHSWLYPNEDCEALFVGAASSLAQETENPYMLLGAGLTARQLVLPRYNLWPEDDPNYRFTAQGRLLGPWVDAGAQTYQKWLNHARIVAENLSAGQTITLSYETEDSGVVVPIATYTTSGVSATSLVDPEIAYARVRYVVDMATDDPTLSPRLIAVVFNSTLNPPRKRQWSLAVEIGDDRQQLGGGASRYAGNDLEDFLFDAMNERLLFTDRRGETYVVHLLELQQVDHRPRASGKRFYQLTLVEI